MSSPTPTPRVDLEELVAEGRRMRELLAKATERPWATTPIGEVVVGDVTGGEIATCHMRPQSDSALIVAAINALPDLLEAVEYAGRFEKALRGMRAVARAGWVQENPRNALTELARLLDAALARPHPDEEADG